ncbi:hypothetical protein ANN_15774 [Periplaneta americana]|uniref:Uncharacterized protein n=1 Tax=Periplaneta americana TaxID=6978 RepID=A0ABQ8SI17_PERAM|nr:hypothetical protein ANN_15774 [Periplaneta americana]
MTGLCEGGNEPPCSLKASKYEGVNTTKHSTDLLSQSMETMNKARYVNNVLIPFFYSICCSQYVRSPLQCTGL